MRNGACAFGVAADADADTDAANSSFIRYGSAGPPISIYQYHRQALAMQLAGLTGIR